MKVTRMGTGQTPTTMTRHSMSRSTLKSTVKSLACAAGLLMALIGAAPVRADDRNDRSHRRHEQRWDRDRGHRREDSRSRERQSRQRDDHRNRPREDRRDWQGRGEDRQNRDRQRDDQQNRDRQNRNEQQNDRRNNRRR